MKIHNFLEPFVEGIRRWEKPPSRQELADTYYRHVQPWIEGVLWIQNAAAFHSAIRELDWTVYRNRCLTLDPAREEARVRKHLKAVEDLFGIQLEGDIIVFGSFEIMDGFARFDCGKHRVYLGVDESHSLGSYLDVLITHELTHVVRESRPSVWQGWGLNPLMTRDEFGESQPVIEHVFGEGFSCTVSELLVPGSDPWNYAYQSSETLAEALRAGPAIDRRIKEEILKPHVKSDYSRLYNTTGYDQPVPPYPQYVWGWQWTKRLLREYAGGDVRKLVDVCSTDLLESALKFELRSIE